MFENQSVQVNRLTAKILTPINHMPNQSIDLATHQPIHRSNQWPNSESTNQLANQSVKPTTCHSTDQTSQSTDHSVQPLNHPPIH